MKKKYKVTYQDGTTSTLNGCLDLADATAYAKRIHPEKQILTVEEKHNEMSTLWL